MCDDAHVHEGGTGGQLGTPRSWAALGGEDTRSGHGLSRRTFLGSAATAGGIAALSVSGVLPGRSQAAAAPAVAEAPSAGFDGGLGYRTAQHIHARGSEGPASMTSQAAEAAKHVNAMWFTDHDWHEAGVGAPRTVHFNSLTSEALPPNPPWTWVKVTNGPLDTGASTGGIESSDVSPNDPDPSGALFARAVSVDARRATLSWFADDVKLRYSMRTPAHGQSWSVDVKLREASANSWGFMRVALSYHPASSERPDAYYFMEYRFGPFANRDYTIEQLDMSGQTVDGGEDGDGKLTLFPGEQALLGVVWVPQMLGAYETQTVTFTDDIERLFPGMLARDNSIRNVWFGATSQSGAAGNACFDYLRMNRVTGQAQYTDRLAITEELAPRYPGVALYNGTELSYGGGHRHWLGGDVQLPDYHTDKAKGARTPSQAELVGIVLAAGGMPIANHPFGTNGPKMSDALATTTARQYVQNLIDTNGGGGLQGLETFYRTRGGATIEHHYWLSRTAIRMGLPLTWSGVSDNHWGRNGSWAQEKNHFVTGIFADSLAERDLLDALRRGRAYSAEIGSYNGRLDLMFDGGTSVMGQIDVRPGVVTRKLRIMASVLGKRQFVQVFQIPIDGAMTGDPGGIIATLAPSAFVNGVAALDVDTTRDTAFAVLVCTQKNASKPVIPVAGSNPIWHLTAEPTTWTIPEYRRV